MKGILLKDLYTVANNKKSLALIFVLGIFFTIGFNDGGQYMSTMLALMLMMSVFSSFSYDESAQWDRYAVCLPVSRLQIVLCKYLLSLIMAAVSVVAVAAVSLGSWLLGGGQPLVNFLFGLGNVGTMLLALSVVIPATYKLGPQKARLVSMLGVVLPLLALVLLTYFVPALQDSTTLLTRILAIGGPVILVLALPLSFFVAVRVYSRQEF